MAIFKVQSKFDKSLVNRGTILAEIVILPRFEINLKEPRSSILKLGPFRRFSTIALKGIQMNINTSYIRKMRYQILAPTKSE